jgi:AcrR family transcriptional regulator
MLPGMGRPANANAAETKRRILESAAGLFAEQGKLASMRTVASAAGVSLGTLHLHFGSKQGLYDACIDAMDEQFGGLAAELVAAGRSGGSLDEIVESVVRRAYAFAREHELAVRLTTRDAVDRGHMDPIRRAMILPEIGEGAELLSQMIGAPVERLRVLIRSVAHLVVRYALTEPRELSLVLGWDPERTTAQAAHAAIADHLVFTTRTMLSALQTEDG